MAKWNHALFDEILHQVRVKYLGQWRLITYKAYAGIALDRIKDRPGMAYRLD